MLVKHGTNLVLVVGVLGDNRGEDLLAGHEVTLLDAHLRHLLLLLLSGHLLRVVLHLHLGVLLHGAGAAHLRSTHRRTVHVAHGTAGLSTHLLLVAVLGTVVGAHAAGATLRLVALVATLTGTAVRAAGTTHGALLLLHEVWHGLEEHLEVELELFLVGEVCPLGTLGVLLAELLEIVLVAGSFVLELTDFLDLVMVDGEGLIVDGKVLFGGGGLIWLLEADESVKLLDTLAGWVHAEGLDLTV